jgi:hypothetical protein
VAVQNGFTDQQIFAEIEGILSIVELELSAQVPSQLEEVTA